MPMEVNTTLAQTIDKINHFVSERDWNQFHTIKNIISSISIEAAELSETIQWSNPPVEEAFKMMRKRGFYKLIERGKKRMYDVFEAVDV